MKSADLLRPTMAQLCQTWAQPLPGLARRQDFNVVFEAGGQKHPVKKSDSGDVESCMRRRLREAKKHINVHHNVAGVCLSIAYRDAMLEKAKGD